MTKYASPIGKVMFGAAVVIMLWLAGFTAGYNTGTRENRRYLYCYNSLGEWDRCRVEGEDRLYSLTGRAHRVTIVKPVEGQ